MFLRFSTGVFVASAIRSAPLVDAAVSVADVELDALGNSLSSPDSLQILLEDGPKKWEEQCTMPVAEEGYPYLMPTDASGVPAGLFSIQDYVDYEGVPAQSWNLPAAVLFPETANDVVSAVNFATSNGIGMSVKTTGHSWTGSGLDKDSLLLNMRHYPKYLAEDGYLMECDDPTTGDSNVVEEDDIATAQLREQACRVAVARGWSAIMRVGGGNLWDEAYRSVSSWNYNRSLTNDSGNWTYHIVGGSAGTVGAAGGWMLQTGLSGSTGMRTFGFGVDQVTQLEMVLPTGQHVRFGPTNWQEDENLAFPRTTEVTGWCNKDPSLPEDEWKWHVCGEEDNINVSFDDLWHANRGGGGGFGIILSIEYQLPDWPGKLGVLDLVLPPDVADFQTVLDPFLSDFQMDALWNPEAVGLSEDESSLCGLPYFLPGAFGLECIGRGGPAYAAAFKAHVEKEKEYLMGLNLTEDQVISLGNGLIPFARGEFNDYAEESLSSDTETGGIPGRLNSYPTPSTSFVHGPFTMCSLISRDFVNSEEGRTMILTAPKSAQYLLGANTATYHDGTTATSQAYRETAFWDYFADSLYPGMSYPTTHLSYTFGDGTPQDSFPPMGGSFNHYSDTVVGPTKANWTKLCPPLSDTFSRSDREELCINKLEFVFGTEGLARLRAIKEAVDPNHLFNCYACVGYREKSGEDISMDTNTPETEPSVAPETEGTDPSGDFPEEESEDPDLVGFPQEESEDPASVGKSGEEDGAKLASAGMPLSFALAWLGSLVLLPMLV